MISRPSGNVEDFLKPFFLILGPPETGARRRQIDVGCFLLHFSKSANLGDWEIPKRRVPKNARDPSEQFLKISSMDLYGIHIQKPKAQIVISYLPFN